MKDLTDSEYADLCDTIKRLRSERNKLRAELATLRATRDADHGAAIEAAAIKLGTQLYGACRGFHETEAIRVAMRALVATVTNSQQKGGEEPCATPTLSEASKHCASNAAPTSDPEGAATQDQIGILSCDNHRMRKFGTLLAEAALYVIREYDGTHRLSLAVSAWAKAIGDEGGRGLLDTTPSPTLEKLAQESAINDAFLELGELSMAKSVLRKLVAKVTAAHEHELRELREECGRLRQAGRDENTRLIEAHAECGRLRKYKERLDWLCANSLSYWKTEVVALVVTEYDGGGNLKEFCRAAIDAAMKPSEEPKP